MKEIKKEKSCGAVVYYKASPSSYYFLIEKMNLGHFSLPKGHVENNETEEQTALREIKEETNLDVVLDTNFRKVVTYMPARGTLKDVVFFVAESKTLDVSPQLIEVTKIYFLEFEKALETLTYKADKEVLQEAYSYLKSNYNN